MWTFHINEYMDGDNGRETQECFELSEDAFRIKNNIKKLKSIRRESHVIIYRENEINLIEKVFIKGMIEIRTIDLMEEIMKQEREHENIYVQKFVKNY